MFTNCLVTLCRPVPFIPRLARRLTISILLLLSVTTGTPTGLAAPPDSAFRAPPIPQPTAYQPGAESCQHCGPTFAYQRCCPIQAVDSAAGCIGREPRWAAHRPLPFEVLGPGEYVGPHRSHHVSKYRVRVDDQLTLIYRLTRDEIPRAYEFNVGDRLRVESDTVGDEQPALIRELIILPDGTIALPLIGQVRAAGRTVDELKEDIREKYRRWYNVSSWTITPIVVDTKLEDLRASVDARAGRGGQAIDLRVSPDGTIQLPGLESVCAQGLTLEELKYEIDQRYAQAGFLGIEVTPLLANRAPTFVYVVGEVRNPGRFILERPTTVMQAIALAGGWDVGGNLRQIVVFRRAEDWRLMATKLDLRGALLGKRPSPADEIFLRDSDIVLVPKEPLRRVDDAIRLLFTEGVNEVAFGILTLTAI